MLALRDPLWLADRVIPERSLSMLWGPPNIGKSFVTLDLACSVATGENWLERSVEPGRVIYVSGEGVHSFKRRLGAWLMFHDRTEEELANLSFINWPIQLQEGVDSFLRLVRPTAPSLIIVDTLAASTLGVDEDSTETIGPVLKSLLKLRKELKAAVMVVHHTGWNVDHERGSSGYRGAMDTSIELKQDKSRCVLVCAKQRDAEHFADIPFRLREIRWGVPVRGTKGKTRTLKSLVPEAV